MSNSLQQFASHHFLDGKRTSLMGGVIDKWSDDEILSSFEIEHRAVRKLAFERLRVLSAEKDQTQLILRGLQGSPAMKAGLLLGLSVLPIEKNSILEEAVLLAINDANRDVRVAAARVVAFRFPNFAEVLLPMLSKEGAAEVARHLCYSNRDDLIPQIAEAVGYPDHRLPPAIGVLVNNFWLAGNVAQHHELVVHLATECGYSDIGVNERVLSLWEEGLTCVTSALANGDTEDWRRRITEFRWQLFPESFGIRSSGCVSVDVNDPIDLALFLSAIREADREQLDLVRTRNPFSINFNSAASNVICCHAKLYFAKQLFIDDAIEIASEIDLSEELHGEFLVDHARVNLILDSDERAEADSILRAKWIVRSRGHAGEISYPVSGDANFIDAKKIVLGDFSHLPNDPRFTSGSHAIIQLANAAKVTDLKGWMVQSEAMWQEFLVPIGVELQVPVMDKNHIVAWKQALRYLGVNSPRRPEYHQMTEAAFRPVRTFHAAVLGPLLLQKLGMIAFAQDMAMHISFQGDLGDDARLIAFPQLFIYPSQRQRKRTSWSIAPLMSKGLVNFNQDVETCDQLNPAMSRTEVRIFRCVADEVDGKIQLRNTYIDDIVSNHIIASAMLQRRPETQECLSEYRSNLERFAKSQGPEFFELLCANYYESTGEPEDVGMLDYLPILTKRSEVRSFIAERDCCAAKIEHDLLRMRANCVQELITVLFGNKANDSGVQITETSCNVSLPEQFSGIENSHSY